MGGYGVHPSGFALVFMLLAAAFVAGAQANIRLVHRVDVQVLLRAALAVEVASLAALVVLAVRGRAARAGPRRPRRDQVLPGRDPAERGCPDDGSLRPRAGSASALMGTAQMGLGAARRPPLLAALPLAPAVGMSTAMLVASCAQRWP